jgi:iron(III) transport system ATP-binding protein
LVVENLCKNYGAVAAIKDVSFETADGEFLTLLGPSGCGKSTTLASIAGLDRPDSGLIRVGDRTYFDSKTRTYMPSEKRNCGLVFQSYALWPHMTVRQNVAYPLRLRKVSASEQKVRVDDMLKLVELYDHADRYPHQLSGGQQQRAALARTLVYEPSILLLDEPLSNLDAKLRERARSWFASLRQRVKITTVYVTHDQVEALVLSDRIVVMNSGRVVQIGTPQEIYETPADPFVADFIGTSSFLSATVCEARGAGDLTTVSLSDGQTIRTHMTQSVSVGEPVTIALRPEKLDIAADEAAVRADEGTVIRVLITSRSYLGARYHYEVELGGTSIKMETSRKLSEGASWAWIPYFGSVVFKGQRKVN